MIYLEDPDVNKPATNGGAKRVPIECTAQAGALVFTTTERWPFRDTDGGVFDPHVHIPVDPALLGSITHCKLKGTNPALEGGRPTRR